jgi:ligand-binding sensor domain-containing protein/two-component sensor histidine kinase
MKKNRFKYFLCDNKRPGIKSVIAVICLLFNSTFLFSQNINNLDIEKVQGDGLKNENILCMNQDKNGFMWFGTLEGLFKYDGYNFTGFSNVSGNSPFLIDKPVLCIYPEKNNLWVGSVGGLSLVDINTRSIKNFPSPGPLVINCIFPKSDSVFWIGSNNGLFQFNKKSFKWEKMTIAAKDVRINSICDDKAGHLYLTFTDGMCCFTTSTGRFDYYYPHLPIYPKTDKILCPNLGKSTLTNDGNLWISTWGGGLVQFNTKTRQVKQWLQATDDLHFIPFHIALDLLADGNGDIWLANKEGGLTIFDPAKNKFTNYPVDWQSENKISSAVACLFRDRSGIVWIGTGNGIFKYDPYNTHLSKTEMRLKTDTGIVPSHSSPLVMLKDKDGLLWMGMYDGLFVFDQKNDVLHSYNKVFSIPSNFAVFNILQDPDGSIWFTAKNLLINVSKKGVTGNNSFRSETFKSPDIQSSITGLYIDKERRIWIGTHKNGIYRFDPASKKFTSCRYAEMSLLPGIKEVRAFCELSKDSLLAGGVNTGLILLHAGTGRYEKIDWDNVPGVPAEASVNGIQKMGTSIWIGTDYSGLWETDIHFKRPLITNLSDGLPSMDISAIANDKHNSLWILTSSGAVKLQTSNKKITVFDKKDGILNLDELNTLFIDDQGSVVIASTGCFYRLMPAQISKNIKPPKVFITSLKVFDKDYSVQKSGMIELDYNQNYFSLEYVALNYTRSRLNRYAYKMDGLDKKWNDAGSRRYVSYANLDEGTYTFNVKACNNEGVWNNVPARLVLIINPPFWHRSWFYFSIVFVIITVIYTIYQYNINQLKIRLQMRDKIARDLHDDIGSTLSGINIFSKIALQQMRPGQPGTELMEKISERSKKTMDALSDIVWSINTRNDGMDNFLMKANEYLSVLEVQNIGFDFTVDEEIHQLKIGMIQKRELYLIFKETICNASKYADCSFVQIYLKRHKDICTLIVSDNGKGFNTGNVSSGNGIYNMHQRAKKMTAGLHIESEENKGTTITLNFRITRFR